MKRDNIVLIGFMGCGKTSIGIRLSYVLQQTLLDTDKWIEQKYKMSVADIFKAYGESAFRKMETGCLEELLKTADRQIISTGGGLPVREQNHRLLKELGTVIYLKVTPDTVYERLKEDNTRPLLQVDNPSEEIGRLMSQRAPVYEACADIIIEVSNKSFDEILQLIIKEAGVLTGQERKENKNEITGD